MPDDEKRRRSTDPSALPAFLDRFHRLSAEDQLAAYEEIRRYLVAHEPEQEADKELRLRREGLEAMRRVAAQLGKEPGRLTAEEFDRERTGLGIKVSSRQIAVAWGSWRLARDALVSGHHRETVQQLSLRLSQIRHPHTRESYLEGLRLWLAHDPPHLGRDYYDAWVRAYNANRPPAALPVATGQTVQRNLELDWSELLRVARGDVAYGNAKRRVITPRTRKGRGAKHDLVGRQETAALLGVRLPQLSSFADKPEFPTPVLVIGGRRHWLREDIVAYGKGHPFPRRALNELARDYLGTSEVGALTGYSPTAVKRLASSATGWVPAPRLIIGTVTIFDRAEVEAAIEARGQQRAHPLRQEASG